MPRAEAELGVERGRSGGSCKLCERVVASRSRVNQDETMIQKKEAYFCSNPGRGGGAHAGGSHLPLLRSATAFVLKASQDNIRARVRLLLSTNRSWRGDCIAPTIRWAGPNS
jgi:hypothetical protein